MLPGFLCLISVLSCIVQYAQCYPVQCADNEIAVQTEGIRPKSNGCSKPDFIGALPGEEDFTFCCDRHDTCYAMCGMSKEYCENDFNKCMKSLCKTNFARNTECKDAAEMYYMGVSMFGENGYGDSQDEYCQCIPKSSSITSSEESSIESSVNVEGITSMQGEDSLTPPLTTTERHYIRLIDKFYSTHGNKDDNKKTSSSREVVLKYSRSIKEAGKSKMTLTKLYYELHKKYDKAIQHTEARIGMKIARPKSQKK